MEISTLLILSLFLSTLFILKLLFFSNHGKAKLPPGPKPLPILGNILQLTDKPHHALADLSRVHGPLMTLKLGHISTLVVSSVDMAREVFVKHDLAFSSRHVPDALRALNHNLHSMVWLPVSPLWRSLRKLAVIHLFSVKRLDAGQPLRETKVRELLEYVGECCGNGQAVDIGRVVFITTLNLMSNTFFSEDLAGYRAESSREFRDIVWRMMACAAKSNLADFFPLFKWFDPHGIRREVAVLYSKLFDVFDGMISRRLSSHSGDCSAYDDVLETLLRISKEDGSDFNLEDIKHLLLDLFTAGTDTTSSTLEWAMTELLRNPSKMKKAQSELNEVLGNNKLNDEKIVKETEIERLPYLQAIVKETLRVHPPAPLLVPHKTQDNVQICGYLLPKSTQLLINAWAIGHDPDTWKDPNEFLPERFLVRIDVDYRGHDFELIPFGAGRRICPGLPLAHRMVHIMLATLLHAFDWELPNGMNEQDIDMNENFGISVRKAKPLLVAPISK